MPYTPGGYVLPAVYLAVPGTTIIAAQHNVPLVDLQDANNYARPIAAGGTAADTAAGARSSLAVPGLADANTFTATNSWSRGADIVSATSLVLGTDGNYFHVTGANTIAEITAVAGAGPIYLVFDGVLTLTHDAVALILPGRASITTAAGDAGIFVEDSSGNWRCIDYQVAAAGPAVGSWTPSFTFTVAGNLSRAFSTQSGSYVRIGKLVIASFVMTTSAFTHTTATGNLILTGLPVAAGVNPSESAAAFGGITKAGYTNFTWQPIASTATANLVASGSGQAATTVDVTDMPTGGTVILRGTIIYTVA